MPNQLQFPLPPGVTQVLQQLQQSEGVIAGLLAQPAKAAGITLPAPPPGLASVLAQFLLPKGAPGETPPRNEALRAGEPGVKTTVI